MVESVSSSKPSWESQRNFSEDWGRFRPFIGRLESNSAIMDCCVSS